MRFLRRVAVLTASLAAFVVVLGGSAASAAPAIQTVRNYDHSGTACPSISTKAGTSGFYKTQSPNSVTGIAFNGTDLLFSCWSDGTITAIRPTANATTYQKDTAVGLNGIWTVTNLPGSGTAGLGSLDWDAQDHVLWACNLTAYTGSQKKLGKDVGYITLSNDGSGTATYTPVATAPDGCVNGIDYNPGDNTVSASGALVNDSNKTIDQFQLNGNLQDTSMTTWKPGTNLTGNGYVSGIEYTTKGLVLADNFSTTKTLWYTTDLQTSTKLSSSSHRYEDVACDAVTFAPKVVVWVEWFDHNQAEPFILPAGDTCGGSGPPPPPPTLTVSQIQSGPVQADSQLTYTVTVTNGGSTDQTNVNLTDTPPANTILGTVTPSQGSCSSSAPISCSFGTVSAGNSASATVTVTPVQPGTVTNTASAVSDQGSSDPSSQGATVTAEANVKYVTVDDGGFSPATTSSPQGGIIQFNFFGGSTHSLSDPTGLISSGSQTPVSFFRQELDAAAAYKVTDSPSGHIGTINVTPIAVGPFTTSGFTVQWATPSVPAGYDEDIQVQLPGTTTWVNWLTNQTGSSTSATYTPTAGTGTYKFRGRLQHGSIATAYSPARSVSVTS